MSRGKRKTRTKRMRFRKTKRQRTKRRQYYGGQLGVDTNPNEFNEEEKVLERQMRILA
jgi:hypothetical protein